jgi:hypothetical protein
MHCKCSFFLLNTQSFFSAQPTRRHVDRIGMEASVQLSCISKQTSRLHVCGASLDMTENLLNKNTFFICIL